MDLGGDLYFEGRVGTSNGCVGVFLGVSLGVSLGAALGASKVNGLGAFLPLPLIGEMLPS